MIRVALIECERPDEYAAALRHVPLLNCTTIVDRDAARCAAACRALDARHVTEDEVQQASDAFEAAIVGTPIAARAARAIQLAKCGKSVCVAFPAAATLNEWAGLTEGLRAAGVKLMVGRPFRTTPYVRTVQQSLQSGKLGAPGLLRIHHWTNHSLTDPMDKVPILQLAGAQVDVACWLFGDRPHSVYALALKQEGQVRSGVQIHLGFPHGGMAHIGCVLAPQAKPYSMVTLIGSRGAAYADDHRNLNLLIRDQLESLIVDQGVEHLSRLLNDFADLVTRNEAQDDSPAEMQTVYVVTQAVVDSIRSGKEATWTGERYDLS